MNHAGPAPRADSLDPHARASQPKFEWRGVALVLAAILFGIAAVAIAHGAWADMLEFAQSDSESGQAMLVPFAFIMLLMARRGTPRGVKPIQRFARMSFAGWWIGPAMVGAGWAAWSFGFRHHRDLYWHGGAELLAVGAAVTLLGAPALLRYWPAFLALAFFVPIPAVGVVSAPLQMVATRATQSIYDAAGIALGRDGNVLSINGHEVAIAEACNGLRMIWPLFMATYLFAFITPMGSWMRLLVLAATPLIAVCANVVRLVPTVWAYGHWENHSAKLFHDASGWVMLLASFLTLVGMARLVRWVSPEPTGTRPITPPSSSDCPATGTSVPRQLIAAVATTVLLLTGTALEARKAGLAFNGQVMADAARYHQSVKDSAGQLPDSSGSLLEEDLPTDELVIESLQPNLIIHRKYTDSKTGHSAEVLLVQIRDARRIAGHAATTCYRCAGWEMTSKSPHDWQVASLLMTGTEYEFYRGNANHSAAIAVADFVLLPDGRISRDMQPAQELAQLAERRYFGAAHLEVVCDAALAEHDRDQMIQAVLTKYTPLIREICQRPGRGSH